MNNIRKLNKVSALITGLMITGAQLNAAVLQVGDKIGIDFGPTTTANWNNIISNNQSIGADSVISLAGGVVVDGVAITTANSQFTNNDGTNSWIGLSSNGGSAPVEFVDSVTTDITGNFSLGDATPYRITISGLNNAFTYNLVAVTTANFSSVDTLLINGVELSSISRPSSQGSGLFHDLSSLSTDGSGNIVIEVRDNSSGVNPVINGAMLTAVPEPGTSILFGLGGMIMLWNRRRY